MGYVGADRSQQLGRCDPGINTYHRRWSLTAALRFVRQRHSFCFSRLVERRGLLSGHTKTTFQHKTSFLTSALHLEALTNLRLTLSAGQLQEVASAERLQAKRTLHITSSKRCLLNLETAWQPQNVFCDENVST
jgi:hypothetical protein